MEYKRRHYGCINADASLAGDLPLALQNRSNRWGNKRSGDCPRGVLFDPILKGKESVNQRSWLDACLSTHEGICPPFSGVDLSHCGSIFCS